MHRQFVAAGLVLGLLSAAPMAAAQPAPPPAAASRHDELAMQFAAIIVEEGFLDGITNAASDRLATGLRDDPDFPADWTPLVMDAIKEELADKRLRFTAVLAREIGGPFTEAELDAGVKMLRTEGGRRTFRAAAHGEPTPTLTRAQQRELDALGNTPAGRAFLKRFSDMDEASMARMGTEVGRVLAGGFMRRLGVKTAAYEAQRAQVLPTEGPAYNFVEAMFDAYGFEAMFGEMASKMSGIGSVTEDWTPLMAEAALEELHASRSKLIGYFAAGLGSQFTDEELRFGVQWFSSEAIRAKMRAKALNQPEPAITRDQQRELDKIARMRGADGFFRKMSSFNLGAGDTQSLIRALVPGLYQRWGVRIEAFEAARVH